MRQSLENEKEQKIVSIREEIAIEMIQNNNNKIARLSVDIRKYPEFLLLCTGTVIH